jgi:hypothetical protein
MATVSQKTSQYGPGDPPANDDDVIVVMGWLHDIADCPEKG